MAQRYYVLNESGGINLPVANNTLYTAEMDFGYQASVLVIAFYDAKGDAVTPTSGTITAEVSPIEGQWQAPSSGDAVISAVNVVAGLATYTLPTFLGPTMQARITLSGVTGAVTCKSYFWRM